MVADVLLGEENGRSDISYVLYKIKALAKRMTFDHFILSLGFWYQALLHVRYLNLVEMETALVVLIVDTLGSITSDHHDTPRCFSGNGSNMLVTEPIYKETNRHPV